MYLKKIEMKGFKSFADKVELDLEKGITGVVGPNGSGKSNIADAVRWVLGEQSAKSLRGEKMEDVIFAGTDGRKPLGFAEVSITIDNADGMLNIEFSEVKVTRRMYRSGESEYFINNSGCRLKDITEMFMDTGVGREGYSIIGQGRVDEIIGAKPEDRREIFEEAAGIVKYKTRKMESERKLESTEQNILRINDIVCELESQIDPLYQESADARRYLDLREKLKSLELNLFVINTDGIKKKLSLLSDQSAKLQSELHDNNWEISKLEDSCASLRDTMRQMDGRIKDAQNGIYEAGSEEQKLNGDLNLLNEREGNAKKEIEEVNGRTAAEKKKLYELQESLSAQRELLKTTGDTVKEQTSLLESKTLEYKDIVSSAEQKEKRIEQIKAEIIELLNQTSEKKSTINSLKTFISGIERRKSQIERERTESVGSINALAEEIKQLGTEIESCRSGIREAENRQSECEREKKAVNDQSASTEREIYELNGRIQSGQGRCRVLHEMETDFEGYNRSVREIMKHRQSDASLNSGVCGVIAELIRVPKMYELAIEVALGGALQNIVTYDEYSAKYCIEFLKKYRYGRATFLPLTTVKAKRQIQIPASIQNSAGFIGTAYSIVGYDKKYQGIISSLLGRVIVADCMDSAIVFARKANYTIRVVTLDGDIINPGGAFTGGSASSRATGILSRKREIEEIEDELRKQNALLSSLRSKKDTYRNRIGVLDEDLKHLSAQRDSFQANVSSLGSRLSAKDAEKGSLERAVKNIENEYAQLSTEYADASQRICDASAELEGIEHHSGELSGRAQSEQDGISGILAAKDETSSYITSLKVKIAECRQSYASVGSKIDEMDGDIEVLNMQISDGEGEIERLEGEIADARRGMDGIRRTIQELNEKSSQMREELKRLSREREEDDSALREGESRKEELGKTSSILREGIHKFEMQQAKFEMELKNLQDRIWEDYEESYASALKYKSEVKSIPEASAEIEKLKKAIKDMGSVNVNAIDEYKKVKERYDFISKQKTDLEEAKDSLKSVISEIVDGMKSQFAANFAVINANFSAYFGQLFGGGKAEVILTDERDVLSCGIEIIAQPPGKKLQSLTLLSGGERALTAIALLFAILKMKPSPFCILDEIEAALDDSNINRFARFLRELSKDTQFIVVTHRKGTMEAADTLYGVTMEEKGISTLVSAKLTEKAS